MLDFSDLEQDQTDCIGFITSGEDSLVCADVGTGKTVISLTAADVALGKHEVSRWLVLAPKLVATEVWASERVEWAHLLRLKISVACGDAESRMAAINSDATIVVMNYENVDWLLEKFPRPRTKKGVREIDTLPFDGLICDEIDKLKEVSSNRFKALRNRITTFKKRVGLTGTLLPNRLTEVWGQTYLIDGGESFGRSFYEWRRKYFYPTDFNQHNWAPLPDTRAMIIEKLSDMAFRLKATNLPEVVYTPPHKLILPASIRGIYNQLESDFFIALEDEHGNKRKVNAANSAVLQGKLQQICAGFSYVDGGKDAVWHTKARFDWYDNLQTGSEGDQILVFYHFQEELDELKRRYPELHYLGKGRTDRQKARSINLWNRGKIEHLALHPGSAGHGLNLQKSGAHHIAFLTWPWSGGMLKQVIGRLVRRGQVADKVYVHGALFDNTVDQLVFDTATGKQDSLEDFLDDLYTATHGKAA